MLLPEMMAASPAQTFVVQCLGFIVVVFVLVKLVFPQLGKILGGRTQGIEETFRKIDQDTQDTGRKLEEIKARLAQMDEESKRRLQAALDDAARTRSQLMSETSAQVEAAADRARREVAIEREKAVLELRQEATDLTLRAADALVQSTMNDSIHGRIVDRYLERLDSVKKT